MTCGASGQAADPHSAAPPPYPSSQNKCGWQVPLELLPFPPEAGPPHPPPGAACPVHEPPC